MGEPTDYGADGVGFMDGEYLPFSELRIPVTDMGFQLADMCYDAVHVRQGRFFRLDDHLDRFQQGLDKRRFDTLGYDRDAIAEVPGRPVLTAPNEAVKKLRRLLEET